MVNEYALYDKAEIDRICMVATPTSHHTSTFSNLRNRPEAIKIKRKKSEELKEFTADDPREDMRAEDTRVAANETSEIIEHAETKEVSSLISRIISPGSPRGNEPQTGEFFLERKSTAASPAKFGFESKSRARSPMAMDVTIQNLARLRKANKIVRP